VEREEVKKDGKVYGMKVMRNNRKNKIKQIQSKKKQ
jgi:hypothetical protein